MPRKGQRYNKKTYSDQQARRDGRNRAINRARLDRIKQRLGCKHCGNRRIPPKKLHAHHVGPKYRDISWLIRRPWKRLKAEITGKKIPGIEKSGGPVIFLCEKCHRKADDEKQRAENGGGK